MTFNIPTQEEIVAKYEGFDSSIDTEEAIATRTAELNALKKDELIAMILESESNKRTGTVQELAKAILKDEEMIAASYETIAMAIMPISSTWLKFSLINSLSPSYTTEMSSNSIPLIASFISASTSSLSASGV